MSEKLEVGRTEDGEFWVNADSGVIDRVTNKRIAELEKSELYWKEEARRYCQDAEYYHEVKEGLKAEVARLRELTAEAYDEGFEDATSHGGCWFTSDAKVALEAGDE